MQKKTRNMEIKDTFT